MSDYANIKIGDRVKFTHVRDPRITNKLEHHTGVVLRETINGWLARTSEVTGATFTVTEANYISHRTPTKKVDHAQRL